MYLRDGMASYWINKLKDLELQAMKLLNLCIRRELFGVVEPDKGKHSAMVEDLKDLHNQRMGMRAAISNFFQFRMFAA